MRLADIFATLTVEVTCEREEDSAALIELFESNGFGAEDWTANVRNRCKACSEGRPGAHEQRLRLGADRPGYRGAGEDGEGDSGGLHALRQVQTICSSAMIAAIAP